MAYEFPKFWPYVRSAWIRCGIEPWLIALNTDRNLEGNVIYVEHPSGEANVLYAKLARIYYASKFCKSNFLVSDIDMLPLRKSYWNFPEDYNGSQIVSWGWDVTPDEPYHLPMCYVGGSSDVLAEVLETGNHTDFVDFVKRFLDKSPGVRSDESCLKWKLSEWDKRDTHLIKISRGWNNGALNRIDRAHWSWTPAQLHENNFIDAHLPRPFSDETVKLYNSLLET